VKPAFARDRTKLTNENGIVIREHASIHSEHGTSAGRDRVAQQRRAPRTFDTGRNDHDVPLVAQPSLKFDWHLEREPRRLATSLDRAAQGRDVTKRRVERDASTCEIDDAVMHAHRAAIQRQPRILRGLHKRKVDEAIQDTVVNYAVWRD